MSWNVINKRRLFICVRDIWSWWLDLLQSIGVCFEHFSRQFQVVSEGPLTFLRTLEEKTKIEATSLKFFYERLKSLFIALQITNLEEFMPIAKVADFCTLIGNYW